jgi:Na+/melibiose symporter-like transporter
VLAYYYPITRQKHQAMRAALAARTAEAAAAD